MKSVYALLLVLGLVLSGCVTKKAADQRARDAYAAGQRQAMMSMAQSPAQSMTVRIQGDVQNPSLPWTQDLTLAKAIVAAGYKGQTDPKTIIIVRNGRVIQVDPSKLLNGQDVPLLPMDIVTLQ
jgi:hypothetical protein